MKPEKIIGKKFVRGKPYYKVKWQGNAKQQATWESPPSLRKYKNLINKYEIKNWGQALDEKFFNPDNYLTKGFAKNNGDSLVEKKEKKSREKQNKRGRRNANLPEKQQIKKKKTQKFEDDSYNQSSSEYNESSEEQEKNNLKRERNKYIQNTSNEQTGQVEQPRPRKKVKKNEKSQQKNKQPSICILDSSFDGQQGKNSNITERQSQNKLSSLEEEDQLDLQKDKNFHQKKNLTRNNGGHQLSEEKSSSQVQIIDPKVFEKKPVPVNQQKQRKISEFLKGSQKNQIALIQSSETVAHVENTHKNQLQPVRNIFNLSLSQSKPLTNDSIKKSSSSKQKSLNLRQHRVISLHTSSQEVNFAIPPKLAPKLVRIYHLQKMAQIEYSNGDMLKLSTSEMIDTHPQQMVSFLQRKMKMKLLCI